MMAGTPPRGERGFTTAAILMVLVVLAMVGTSVYRNVRTDAKLSGKSATRVKADFLAESAVTWALAEIGRDRGSFVPFTKATHDPTGDTALANTVNGITQGRKLLTSEVEGVYSGVSVTAYSSGTYKGWIYQTTTSASASISGKAPETLRFKVWYPSSPANTVRISAMGVNPSDTARVEFTGTFSNVFIPCPSC
jgi:Tfp pilus assembly protein PilX